MLPTIVGRSAEGSGMLPTIVGRSAGGLGMLPTIVGKSAGGSGVFPTIVGCLLLRKVSIIGGFANISAEKIGFRKRIFCIKFYAYENDFLFIIACLAFLSRRTQAGQPIC